MRFRRGDGDRRGEGDGEGDIKMRFRRTDDDRFWWVLDGEALREGDLISKRATFSFRVFFKPAKKKVGPLPQKNRPLLSSQPRFASFGMSEFAPVDHHALRRKEVMRVHGRAVQKLCGPEWRSKYVALLLVGASLYASLVLAPSLQRWSTWLLLAYVGGATLSNALFLAIHELSHGLMFTSRGANTAFAMIVNLPIFIPYSVAFREFHLEHHKHLHSERDMDVPTAFEARVVGANSVLRVAWVALQLVVYAIRPMCVRSPTVTPAFVANAALQVAFDAAVASRFGYAPFVFQLVSMLMAGGLHPTAGHFFAEHDALHVVDATPQRTYSYYGWLNWVSWNVGFHNEHHDFPYVPGSRLPQLRRIAPDFYDDSSAHSWTRAIVATLTDTRCRPATKAPDAKAE